MKKVSVADLVGYFRIDTMDLFVYPNGTTFINICGQFWDYELNDTSFIKDEIEFVLDCKNL